ncbi:MAG: hypothetical protein R6V77_03720 [Candidatus Cloacimonadaceae bacterium]
MTIFKTYIILLGLAALCLPGVLSADKYAGEIFQMSPGVANQAMGNTGYTNAEAISAAWWNPALLALKGDKGIELMHAEQFEGLMQFNHISAILGSEHRLGLVITHIGIDDIAITGLENDSLPPSATNPPQVLKRVNNNDLMAYFGIATSTRDNLHIGVTPKLAYRSLAEKTGFGFGADLGMLWQMSSKLRLGAVAKDFFTTQIFWENGTNESVYPSAHVELGFETKVSSKAIPVIIRLGAETLTESRKEAATLDAGIFSADFHAGIAVLPIPQIKLMAGYDIDSITAGLGIYLKKLAVEYAIKPGSKDDLGTSQRISAGWRW